VVAEVLRGGVELAEAETGWEFPGWPVVGELMEERRRRGTGDGSMEKELRAPVVRLMSTTV
jgi:hypothetical protein